MSLRILLLCLPVIAVTSASCSSTLSPTAASSTSASTPATPTALTGRVVRTGTTDGIASASVTLADSSANVFTTTTDATGAFTFPNLAAGTFELQAAAPGYVVSVSTLTFPVSSYTVQLVPEGSAPVSTMAIAITGPATLAVGKSSQLTASVIYTDGTRKDVTSVATWKSTVSSVATVSTTGLLTAYSAGPTVVTASFVDVSGSLPVATTSP
jgi:hypothetical protein